MESAKQAKKQVGATYKGYRWRCGEFWKRGEPLTEQDKKMLQIVKNYYERHGYPPSRKMIPNAGALKKRFRIWGDVLYAAGVPPMDDRECILRKQAAMEWEKRVKAEH